MPSIADQLRAIANQLDGTAPPPPVDTIAATPAGMVRVTPTGVNAAVSRLYPKLGSLPTPLPLTVGIWSYTTYLAFNNMRRADGTVYCSQPTVWAVNREPLPAAGEDPSARYATAIDKVEYPEDWMTQEEINAAAARAAAQGPAVWISTPQPSAPTGETDVPIGTEP